MIALGTERTIDTLLSRGRIDADAVWARALDEATVILLRATSPPAALLRAEREDTDPDADEPYRALVRNVAPRAILVACEDTSCAAAFWTISGDQRFCSARCRQRTACRRHRRVRQPRPVARTPAPRPLRVPTPRRVPLSRGQERHRSSCRCLACQHSPAPAQKQPSVPSIRQSPPGATWRPYEAEIWSDGHPTRAAGGG